MYIYTRRYQNDGLGRIGVSGQISRGMVDKAHSAGLLSEIAKNRCQACVSMGNSGSHPQYNLLKAIGPEDAIEAVRLARRVLLELYEPASITDED